MCADTFEEADVHRYLLHLINREKASVSSQNIAINAIKFYLEQVKKGERKAYYIDRPRKETKLPRIRKATRSRYSLARHPE